MRTIPIVMFPERREKPVRARVGFSQGLSLALKTSLTSRVAMWSLFLQRISVVHVNYSIAAATQGAQVPGSASLT